eukprot:gene17398-19141_t
MNAYLLLALVGCVNSYQPYEIISEQQEAYPLPKLNYKYDELEPFIDEKTMTVHHTGHHLAYTNKMNAALKEWRNSKENSGLSSKSILEIVKNVEDIPSKWRNAIRNNGGGYVNHAIYFSVMSPNKDKIERAPSGIIQQKMFTSFGNYSLFKEIFTKSASTLFGSGYVWLCREPRNDILTIFPTDNQQCPLTFGLQPILVVDVWEHAYYLKHQNKRMSYIKDWWMVVDWNNVENLYHFWEKGNAHTEL